MSGIKGFSIITITFLMIAFLFMGIGRSQDIDKEYEKKYNEILLHEINQPVTIITRVKKEGQETKYFETINESYFMTDIFKDYSLNLFIGYTEELTEKLEIESIVANNNISLDFIQDDQAFKHRSKHKSFVVFPLLPELTMTDKNISITIYYKPNKEKIITKEFIIYADQINDIFMEIEKWYKEHEIKKPKMVI